MATTSGLNPSVDVYDEEFQRNLQLAKGLTSQLKKKADKEIAAKWILKLMDMKSTDPTVKKNRNHFLKYMLTVLHKGVDEAPKAHFGYPQYTEEHGPIGEQKEGTDFMSRWSGDKRTYVAVKPLPGKGALVYMAVSKDPALGWDNHGTH